MSIEKINKNDSRTAKVGRFLKSWAELAFIRPAPVDITAHPDEQPAQPYDQFAHQAPDKNVVRVDFQEKKRAS